MTLMHNLSAACLLTIGLVIAGTTTDVKAGDIQIGDKAPAFSALDDTGKEWNSAEVIGKKIVVVYFYPADMTGGCTKQACAFRDDQPQLAAKDVLVVGVSGDTVENHQLFKQVYQLNFPLLADTKGEIANAFGVPAKAGGSIQRTIGDKDFTLSRSLTTARWTFVIDKAGKIVHKNTSVNAAEDSKAVLKVINSL